MTVVQILLLIIVGYFCLYALIHRICTCVENCAIAKAYGKSVKISDLKAEMDKK